MILTLNSDKIGACASTLCAVHCLALPILVLVGAESFIQFAYTELVEKLLLGTALIIALLAFVPGYLKHKEHYILVLFLAGFVLLFIGEELPSAFSQLAVPAVGAGVIVYAHIQNYRLKKKICKC